MGGQTTLLCVCPTVRVIHARKFPYYSQKPSRLHFISRGNPAYTDIQILSVCTWATGFYLSVLDQKKSKI